MDVQICSGAGKKFMVLASENEVLGYEKEMLEQNNIKSLLPFYTVNRNGRYEYWYDVTNLKSVESVLSEKGIDFEILLMIFSYANSALKQISEYLIKESDILFQANTMYIGNEQMRLCFMPGANDGDRGFLPLGEYLVSNVDPGRELINRFCFELYSMMSIPGFQCEEACNRIREEVLREEEVRRDRERETEKATLLKNEDIELETESESVFSRKREKDENDEAFSEKVKKWFDERVKRIREWLRNCASDFVPEREKNMLNEKEVGRLIYDGDEQESDYCVDKELFKVGNVNGNDAVLHSSLMSRHHSKIRRKNGRFYLTDWNSRKGTYHNGRRLRKGEVVELMPMDRIVFADVPYRWA